MICFRGLIVDILLLTPKPFPLGRAMGLPPIALPLPLPSSSLWEEPGSHHRLLSTGLPFWEGPGGQHCLPSINNCSINPARLSPALPFWKVQGDITTGPPFTLPFWAAAPVGVNDLCYHTGQSWISVSSFLRFSVPP